MIVKLPTLECKRCGWRWHPYIKEVRLCPKCKSAYWDLEKRIVRKGKNNSKIIRIIKYPSKHLYSDDVNQRLSEMKNIEVTHKVTALPLPLDCKRCNFVWTPHKSDIRMCPRCKSAYWDTPKKNVLNKKFLKTKVSNFIKQMPYKEEQ